MASVVKENVAFRPQTRTGFPLDRYGPVAGVHAGKKKTSLPLHKIITRSAALVRRIEGKVSSEAVRKQVK